MAGGSDSHNTGSPYRQDNFYGGHADGATGLVAQAHGRGLAGRHDWTCASRTRPD